MNALIADKKKWLKTNLKGLKVAFFEKKDKTIHLYNRTGGHVGEFTHDFISLYSLALLEMGIRRIRPDGTIHVNASDL